MKVRFFDYPFQFNEHADEYTRIFREVCGKGAFILGEELERFEEEFASFVGAKHAVGVGNGTDALLLALRAAGVGLGDEVITASHTFVATVEVIHLLGAKPVFVDIADDHNMNVHEVEGRITGRTRAVIPVQLNGRVCTDMDILVEVAEKHGIAIIEDSAQAIGASLKGRGAGTFGLAGCFSFYPAKVLGAFGDAGAIVTGDDGFAKKLRALRNHGRGDHGEVVVWGQNSRMDNLHAAILRFRLTKLPGAIERRREIAAMFHDGLSGVSSLRLPPPPEDGIDRYDVYQNYEIEAEGRDQLANHLKEEGIEVALPWGGKAVHQFEALGFGGRELPRTEELFDRVVMLPMYPSLSDAEVEHAIQATRTLFDTGKHEKGYA